MVRRLKVDYDEENDILWLHEGKHVKDSLELDNFILDFSGNEVVGVEIMNVSEVLMRITSRSKSVVSKILGNIEFAKIRTYVEKNLIFVVVLLKINNVDQLTQIPVTVNAPRQVMMARA